MLELFDPSSRRGRLHSKFKLLLLFLNNYLLKEDCVLKRQNDTENVFKILKACVRCKMVVVL